MPHPIHNPTLVFKGQGLSTLDFATLTELIQTMVTNITGGTWDMGHGTWDITPML